MSYAVIIKGRQLGRSKCKSMCKGRFSHAVMQPHPERLQKYNTLMRYHYYGSTIYYCRSKLSLAARGHIQRGIVREAMAHRS